MMGIDSTSSIIQVRLDGAGKCLYN
jgi:hypothetical protein